MAASANDNIIGDLMLIYSNQKQKEFVFNENGQKYQKMIDQISQS